MKFVLTLKHWQLFLVTFGIPFGLYIAFFVSIFATMIFRPGGPEPFPASLIAWGVVVASAWIIALVCSLSWHFHVATGLYKKRPAGSTLKIKRFYFAFFYPFAYLVILLLCMLLFVVPNMELMDNDSPQPPTFLAWFALIIPFHLFVAVCAFYIFYFIGKALKSVELQREPQINEYVAEFVLTWMFMIGVWFIQPRINQIFSDPTPTSTSPS